MLSKKRNKLILLGVVAGVLILASAAIFWYRSKGRTDSDKCPVGESFTFVGNPTGMTNEEMLAASTCHSTDYKTNGVY
jgi:flagellar basal body-associated protein FliL